MEWIEIEGAGGQIIGAVGFLDGRAAIIVSYYDDADANRDGSVSWMEWFASVISPISLDGQAVAEVAMAARFNMEASLRDSSLHTWTAQIFQQRFTSAVSDGVFAVYFGRIVGMSATSISSRLVGGTIRSFIVARSMETVVGNELREIMDPLPTGGTSTRR